ncbi:MAG TPA: 3-phosphoshikimate 1-carboxyvinyltransferase, partial [Gemmatimonadales bacterium]|nr:3-phosphoshikimate 1-carboxyvinyltransferase [Gemmatimonadales bacterium]
MIVDGVVRVPGDKSITHRALMFGALARGTSHVGGALTSLDAKSTARVLRGLGATVSPLARDRLVTVAGRARLARPAGVLDCGNSGTTARLVLGILAGHAFTASLTGDRSLRRRPMKRVTVPLAQMGARFSGMTGDHLPLVIRGGRLHALEYQMPVSSAQIKSSLLLAGVTGRVPVALREPTGRSRDHTERMLRAFGYVVEEDDAGWIRFEPTGRIEPFDMQVPGDPSSAAFLVGAAVLAEGGSLRVAGVGVNPTRTGFLAVLRRMGAAPRLEEEDTSFGEPIADLVVGPADLVATEVTAGEIPGLIDEIPLLAVVASRARGTTVF